MGADIVASGNNAAKKALSVPSIEDDDIVIASAPNSRRARRVMTASDAVSLEDIIGVDEDGHEKMYTTLYDDKGNIISTNDPDLADESNYDKDGKTVDLGTAVNIRFRIAEIIPNGEEHGVNENVLYKMELPEELIPVDEDEDGNKLVNPTEPVEFFQSQGDLMAYGGIYKEDDDSKYELRMRFEGVEDQIDISGAFQYGAKVSDTLTPGTTYTLTYVPGGEVSFTVTPAVQPVETDRYTISLSGSSIGPTAFEWYANIVRKSENANDSETDYTFPYKEMTITSDDAVGIWVSKKFGIFDTYGENTGRGFSIIVTYSTEDAQGNNISECIKATENNIIPSEPGTKVVRFQGTQNSEFQADVKFDWDDAANINEARSRDKNENSYYITNTAHISITDGNGGAAKNIKSIELYIPTITYDDYMREGSCTYNGRLTLSGADDSVKYPEVNANGSFDANYGYFYAPSLSESIGYGGKNPGSTYEYLDEKNYTYAQSGTGYYKGNYYWMEFNPAVSNTAGVNYYISNKSFLPNNKLTVSGDTGNDSSFTSDNANTCLNGMVGNSDWINAGTVSVSQIKGDRNLVADIFKDDDAFDAKLQYQLKKVFADAADSGQLIIYRSTKPHWCGEYSYIIVDPDTYSTANSNKNYGWYEHIKGNENYEPSAKPASWRLHVFNAPQTSLFASMYQHLGSFNVNDKSGEGYIKDQVKTGLGKYNSEAEYSSEASYKVSKYQSSYMNARWVNDDTIFWEFTFDATNFPEWSKGSIYTKIPGNMKANWSWENINVDGVSMTPNDIYVKKTDEGWERISWTKKQGQGSGWPTNDIDKLNCETSLQSDDWDDYLYRIDYIQPEGMTQYRDSDNDITIGFLTRVTGAPKNDREYECSAEFVVNNGDISKLAGDNGGFPTGTVGKEAQYPIRISATGKTAVPKIYKSGTISSNGTNTEVTTADWTISTTIFPSEYAGRLSSPVVSGNYGGYNGRLAISDTMRKSIAKDATGKTLNNIKPGRYTYITQVQGFYFQTLNGGNGGGGAIPYVDAKGTLKGDYQWEKYVGKGTEWSRMNTAQNCWKPREAGIYRFIDFFTGPEGYNKFEIYVYYAGNMEDSVRSALGSQISSVGADPDNSVFDDSFVVEYRNIPHAYSGGTFSPIQYTTELDNTAFYEAAAKDSNLTANQEYAAYYDIELNNSASCGVWKKIKKDPVTEKVSKRISAQLSIEKTAYGIKPTDSYNGTYELQVSNGFSPTTEISVEDYITGFANTEKKLDADNKPILTDPTYNTEGTGAEVKTLIEYLDIENVTIKMRLSNQQKFTTSVYENGNFTSDWQESKFETSGNAGYTSDKKGSLFKVTLKKTDESDIPAGAEFLISYSAKLNMDTPLEGESTTFRQSVYYLGGGLQISNGAVASRPYTPVNGNSISTYAAAQMPSGVVDGTTLTVDCGGSVSNVYLTKDQLDKIHANGTSGTEKWLYSAYTGTMGKTGSEFILDDRLRYDIGSENKFTFTDPEKGKVTVSTLPDGPAKENLKILLEHIIERNTTYKNIKLYYQDTKPTSVGSVQQDKLIWDLGEDFMISGGTEVLSGTIDATGLTSAEFGATPSGSSLTWAGSSELPGVELTLGTAPATLGWNREEGSLTHSHAGFTVTARGLDYEKYLVAAYDTVIDWNAVNREAQKILGNYSTSGGKIKNEVSDDSGDSKESTGSTVQITESKLTKTVESVNKTEGTAKWNITAGTGSRNEDELVITDTLTAQVTDDVDDRVKNAAEAAMYIEPSSIEIKKQYYGTIYKNGQFQNLYGWTADNLEVTVDGRNLKIVIKNVEGSKVLASGQTYMINYKSGFDKEKFLENGGKKDDTYKLLNSAGTQYGSLQLSASMDAEFKPNIPIEADKKVDKVWGNTAYWTATADTKDAARKEFTLTDAVSTANEKAKDALYIGEMKISVENTEDHTVTEYTPETLPADIAVLTAEDGTTPFELGKTGNSGFSLKFAELAAHRKVTVKYTTVLDQEAYLAAGGADGDKVTLKNAFQAGGSDGYESGKSASAEVTVQKPFEKKGTLGSRSDDGQMIKWTFNVSLTSYFKPDDLKNMTEVTITDRLHSALKYVGGSAVVLDPRGEAVANEVVTSGQDLKITVKDPVLHPNFTITFDTLCQASLDGLENSADLLIDGVKKETTKSDDVGKVVVGNQNGVIQSSTIPAFVPTAKKYVDNEICTEDGKYQFKLTAVDEQGNVLTGEDAYSETKSNNGAGEIEYTQIKYKSVGTYYYQISELGKDAEDTRIFTIRVVVDKVSGGYVTSSEIVSPENYGEVRFDNTTKPKTTSFTVTKTWDDGNDSAEMRPESITVYLYQNGEPYNNMSVTLSEDNNWTYTWTDLPVAGGEYSAVEEPVPGYQGTVTSDNEHAVITNRVVSGGLTITKTVTGENGDKNREFTFNVSLKDVAGNALAGSYPYYKGSNVKAGEIADGGSVKLKDGESITIVGLPGGTRYEVTEVEANRDGYETKVTNGTGTIENGSVAVAAFVNDKSTPEEPTKPTEPTNPSEPENPTNPSNPTKPEEPTNPTRPTRPSSDDSDEPETVVKPPKKPGKSTETTPAETTGTVETETSVEITTSEETEVTETETSETLTETSTEETPEKIPQTGQTWWPVPILVVLGVMMISSGVYMKRGNRRDDEK